MCSLESWGQRTEFDPHNQCKKTITTNKKICVTMSLAIQELGRWKHVGPWDWLVGQLSQTGAFQAKWEIQLHQNNVDSQLSVLWPLFKLITQSLRSIVEGKVFILDTRERTVRGIWKCPAQGEKVVEWIFPAYWPWQGEEREGESKKEREKDAERGARENREEIMSYKDYELRGGNMSWRRLG